MEWTDEQRAELAREYTRTGYVAGERWPAPPDHLMPADLLELFRRIPDGAGARGVLCRIGKARTMKMRDRAV